ncbi:MAG: adenosine deaminase [Anaerolineales bacterium]|nr:adenosine deaminase [Anaerolineales bacterium]
MDYQKLPKVELHRHLEGSLRLATMLDIAGAHGITARLRHLVQVQNGEPFTYQNFLAKFTTLRMFYRSPEVIHRITREAIEDADKDNVRYLELRFTPVALSRAERFPMDEVIDWVCESAQKAAGEFGIMVRLLASVNRHESLELAEQVAWLAADRIEKGLVGLDLAGNEAECPVQPFVGIFHEAQQAGLRITVHAGEWAGAASVRSALEDMNAERIGHGVRILEDQSVVALARERGATFDVCVTSNYQSGVVPSLEAHPLLKMLEAGLNVTLATDDPGISQITLGDEYRQACETLGMTRQVLDERLLAAARAAFLPDEERAGLVSRLKKEFRRQRSLYDPGFFQCP